jgi:alcohol dehydrogenase (cytochrome c)
MLRGMSPTTVPSASRVALAFGMALTIGAAATMDAGQSPAGAPARVALYTDAQATAGEALYRRSCSGCHGATLTGGTAPPLTGPAFETSWSDPRVTLADTFFIARARRCSARVEHLDRTGSAAAVFAYILRMNGFPAGATPLTATSEPLESAHLAIANPAARAAAPEFIPGSAAAAPASSGPDQATLTGASQSTDWLVHTHDYGGTRFSPLHEVNATTAPRLAPACLFQVGDRDNFQTGPIVYNGTMYITTTASTIALDAATCRVKWRHAWQSRAVVAFQRNRGVALTAGRVFRGTPDGYLLALNSETGAQLWARRIEAGRRRDLR